jgi:hypothetical protein
MTSTGLIGKPVRMPATRRVPEPVQSVDVQVDDTGVVLTIQGYLDDATGEELVKTAAAAIDDQTSRLDIDLSALTGYTDEGAESLVACRELCSDLPDGLHYRTTQGPGQQALLAAYSEAEDQVDEGVDSDLA